MSHRNDPPHTRTAAERRHDVRVVVSLPGRYVLTRRRALDGSKPEFACRLVNISRHGMVLAGPVIGALEEPVAAGFDEFGKLEGKVLRRLYGGFAMSIVADADRLDRLEAKLAWLDKHQRDDTPNARQHKRIVPVNPHSTLILADGSVMPCFVIDMSASGVAVSADLRPPIGSCRAAAHQAAGAAAPGRLRPRLPRDRADRRRGAAGEQALRRPDQACGQTHGARDTRPGTGTAASSVTARSVPWRFTPPDCRSAAWCRASPPRAGGSGRP
ncbi:hypothetical protein PQJ75_30330 [Rhodoplanes sp. TEM]|uniref:PilZ domain-containing protein n=1 Tax=Rhodoplanes tepidamans TaxID=200616 RepID=A0ABT5J8Q8_RHOTP|nr:MULTISPECIES: hypothetical protein [Rhodoplanes]MDC7785857.1 hypothetical protein [Rhodoplanes tepidamans]MDC7988048.1 hypothetical protein [Rhodoplanes sp. TEM]MDQ0357396.1 hypothetical protein [Rhodoplanes tepidamans]